MEKYTFAFLLLLIVCCAQTLKASYSFNRSTDYIIEEEKYDSKKLGWLLKTIGYNNLEQQQETIERPYPIGRVDAKTLLAKVDDIELHFHSTFQSSSQEVMSILTVGKDSSGFLVCSSMITAESVDENIMKLTFESMVMGAPTGLFIKGLIGVIEYYSRIAFKKKNRFLIPTEDENAIKEIYQLCVKKLDKIEIINSSSSKDV